MDCSVYVSRKTDGEIARLDMEALDGEDLWTAIGRCFPKACDMMDEGMVLGVDESQYDRDLDEIFDATYGRVADEELAKWLATYRGKVVELDGGRPRVLKTFDCEDRERLVGWCADWAVEHIERSGKDTSEMDVRAQIGGEEVWSWLEECE